MGGRLSRTSLLCATALVGWGAAPALAQDASAPGQAASAGGSGNEIIVTGNRRSTTLQDAPINISAVSQDMIENQRLDDIRSLASFVPGVTVQDTGPGSSGTIVMRGLSTGSGSAVGIYLGEIPLSTDFKTLDMSRVEVLQGPQGTLYGLGTLAGAIRYIPNRPTTDRFSVDLHGRGYAESHSDDFGGEGDVAVNIPLLKDHIAFRTSTGYYDNAGFIDYNYLLRDPGVSDPQPGRATSTSTGSFGTPAQQGANFRRKADLNYEHTLSTRNQLLLEYNPNIKAYLTYMHQKTKVGGAQDNAAGVLGTGNYEGPWRYQEPSERRSDLFSAEVYVNLFDIAQLVSATAYTKQHSESTGDNTDLLLDLDYGYEAFPAFSSYAINKSHTNQFNQEVRLVSTHGGPINWVIGGFYNRQKYASERHEYTPGYAAFAGSSRIDDLEYISQVNTKNTEKAVYGEGTLHITKKLQVTGGIRYFKYDADVSGGSALPLLNSGIGAYPSETINANRFRAGSTGKSGIVWKANTSYKFSDNLMAYFTYSTGYRTGGVNRVVPCVLPLKPGQNLCALPNELSYGPDKTRNEELGIRGSLFDKRLQFTLAGYHIDWSDVQVPSQTVNGAIGITVNGAKAVSKGIDFSTQLRVTRNLNVIGTYSYTDAHLTQFVPGILVSQGVRYDGEPGDRLPGSQKNSGSVQVNYSYPLGDGRKIEADWATVYHGNIYSKVGLGAFGEVIPHYITHSVSLKYVNKLFEIGMYADNLFDKYAITGVGNDYSSFNQVRTNVVERYYTHSVLTPRRVGIEFRIHY